MKDINIVVYAVAGACFIYLLLMYIMQKVKSKGFDNRLQSAQREYEEAKKNLSENRHKLIQIIGDIYGHSYGHMVNIGTLWEGMPMHLLLVAKGKANNIKQTVDTNAIMQTWYYTQYDPKTGGHKPSLEVVLKNNMVVRWQESV